MNTFLKNGITGHRGNCAAFPENTLPSFASAIKLGVDWIELDVHFSRDGKLIVCHDSSTGRTCNQNLEINETTSLELRKLNAAAAWNAKNPEKEPMNEPLPYLKEVLELIAAQNRTRVSIQPKMNCVEAVCSLIKKMHLNEYTGFNDTNLSLIKTGKELIPEATVFYDISRDDVPTAIENSLKYGFASIVTEKSQICQENTDAVIKANLEPGAWTVNNPEEFLAFRQMGITRFYTDHPENFLNLLDN